MVKSLVMRASAVFAVAIAWPAWVPQASGAPTGVPAELANRSRSASGDSCEKFLQISRKSEQINQLLEKQIATLETELTRADPTQSARAIDDARIRAIQLYEKLDQTVSYRAVAERKSDPSMREGGGSAVRRSGASYGFREIYNYRPEYLNDPCGWVLVNIQSLEFWEKAYSLRVDLLKKTLETAKGQRKGATK